ncbi:MAG: hypothetical protein PHF37_04095 [Phycisphaerae bacterium]|nr:hypothetical protein [Phycisphaerae bacterium]
MDKKSGNFFEQNIEKIVLAVFAVISLYILFTQAVLSPHKIEFNGRKVQPSQIDRLIVEKADELEQKLAEKPKPKEPYQSRVNDFLAKMNSSLNGINTDIPLPIPAPGKINSLKDRLYNLPKIAAPEDVVANNIRAVAYLPTEEVTGDLPYDEPRSKPGDLDLVTVQASIDVKGLYQSFYESFVTNVAKTEWSDPCLAIPVFAAVQLERQELGSNGQWSDWQIIPRPIIESSREVRDVIENTADLPATGIKVRMLKYNNSSVRSKILQPQAYKIASQNEEWYPPQLHAKYLSYIEDIKKQERMQAMVEQKRLKDEEREKKRTERTAGRQEKTQPVEKSGTPDMGMGMDMMMGGGGGGAPQLPSRTQQPDRSTKKRERNQTTSERKNPLLEKELPQLTEIDDEFEDILLTEDTKPEKLETILFWANDDTVEPHKSYRYRIKVGLFNPVAGTGQVAQADEDMDKKIILWSDYSDVTGMVSIPDVLYFFPRDIQEAAKTVTVQVSRYTMGYWYSQDFIVGPGEIIGEVRPYEPTEEELQAIQDDSLPETVDYDTGVMMVDIAQVTEWAGNRNLAERRYIDMLYSSDGSNIERLPTKANYWPDELREKSNEIKKLEKEPKEPLRSWQGERSAPGYKQVPGFEGINEFDPMMMGPMMPMGPPRK